MEAQQDLLLNKKLFTFITDVSSTPPEKLSYDGHQFKITSGEIIAKLNTGYIEFMRASDTKAIISSEMPREPIKEENIFDFAIQLAESVPDEELDKIPSDLSKNLDHYLYGCSKTD